MATELFANNASALLAASIDDNDLTIQLASGYGVLFPNPGAGEYFYVALENADGDVELVKIESRTTDLLTVASGGRGQDGTTAQSWTNGQTRVECRLSKATMENLLQKGGGTMSGDIDMNGNEVVDAVLSGTGTKMLDGEIVGVPLRGTTGDASNEIAVPSDGSRATAGGSNILVAADLATTVRNGVFAAGMVMQWYGSAGAVPAGFAICDGSNGTPDMRGRFAIGVSGSYALDSDGGAATASGNTESGGAHTHTGTAAGHALTVAELPAHGHSIFAVNNALDSNADGWQVANSMGIPGENVGPFAYRDQNGAGNDLVQDTGGGAAHDHDVTVDSGGAHTHALSSVSILPPYRALYYIMKTA